MKPTMDPKLYGAAKSGDVGRLEQVANENIELLLSKAPQENTALHIAARFGREGFTKKILQLCNQLFWMQNSDDETALHCAARGGCLDVVKILMDHELNRADHVAVGLLRMQNKEGDTALHEALRNRHTNMAIEMVQADPKLPFVVNNAKESSFLLAAKHGMRRVMEEMLSNDGSANRGEQQAAAGSNSSDTIIPIPTMSELTTEEKSELIGIQDSTGRTALHYAAWRNHKIARMILKTDSHHVPYIADNNGHSPLHVAVALGKQRSMLELLKHCPDAIEQLDTSGRNVLHFALLNRRYRIARKLLELPDTEGFLNGPDKEGNTPLHLAFKHGIRISNRKAKPATRNKDGQTARRRSSFLRAWPQPMPDLTVEKRSLEARKDQQQVLTLIASLIATVTFAAAYTLPGGYRSSNEANPGTAILASKPAFTAFLIFDTLSMCLSISAIICYIPAYGPITAEKPSTVPHVLIWGNRLTLTACICMLCAFSAGVFAAVADESMPLAVVVYVICSFLPFFLALVLITMLCRWLGLTQLRGIIRKKLFH